MLCGMSDGNAGNVKKSIVRLIPGVALAAAVMLVSLPLARVLGGWVLQLQGLESVGGKSPISGVTVAIVLGLLIRNLLPVPAFFTPGLKFAVAKLLRLGIIFIGIKLSLLDVLKLGLWGVPVVVASIAAGLLFVTWFNRRLHLPDRLGTLIAAGTGICGVTAIISTAPAIDADETEVAYAVANITLFGLMGMLVYPYLAPLLLASSEQIGLFLGTAIHDTSQVVGAALTYKEIHNDDVAFEAATVTKLTRNLFLAAVVPLSAAMYMRKKHGAGGGKKVQMSKLFPMFVLGFLAMALVRTIGDATLASGKAFGVFSPHAWQRVTREIGEVWGARYLLGTAMGAVGLSTSFAVFRGVGFKPFAVGFAGSLVVGAVGLIMALLLGRHVHL